MKNMINRYVYDVARRLPERERDEVEQELRANIYDMLPEEADEQQIRQVLHQLGAPALLAEQYRHQPRYLISPAFYEDYIRTLKWLLPLIGGVLLVIGLIMGFSDALQNGELSLSGLLGDIIGSGLGMAFEGVVQTLLWVTAGFVIAERVGAKRGSEWKIEDLPEVEKEPRGKISVSESIVELVLTIFFSAMLILACAGLLPIVFSFAGHSTGTFPLFNLDFLAACIPAIAIMGALGVCECIAKMIHRRWSPMVGTVTIIDSLGSMTAALVVLGRYDILSAECMEYIKGAQWGSHDLLRVIANDGMQPVLTWIMAIIIICTLIGCGMTVYKVIKYRR